MGGLYRQALIPLANLLLSWEARIFCTTDRQLISNVVMGATVVNIPSTAMGLND